MRRARFLVLAGIVVPCLQLIACAGETSRESRPLDPHTNTTADPGPPFLTLGPSDRSTGNGRIVFVGEKHDSPDETVQGHERVYSVDADGTGLTVLRTARRTGVYSSDHFGELVWSPDGSRLAVTGQPVNFTVNATGGDLTRLRIPGFISGLAWSPDADIVAFYRAGGREPVPGTDQERAAQITVRDLTSGVEHTITQWIRGLGESWGTGPLSWLPDGSGMTVVVQRASGTGEYGFVFTSAVHTIGLDGTDLGPVPGTASATAARLSPDGKQVAFVRGGPDHCPAALFVVDVDGNHPRRLGDIACDREAVFAWSPDARSVAYADGRFPQPSIWVMDSDGGSRRAVVAAGSLDIHQVLALGWQPVG